jgi:hypothetical protein
VNVKSRYEIPWTEVLRTQIEAAHERLNERRGAIKLVANRAETAGITAVRSQEDVVPLLFAHTSYKSYPESWLTQGKWDLMGQWLDTLSTHRVKDIDTQGVKDVDEWFSRLEAAGHYIASSSGTTGKCSMANASMADLEFVRSNSQAVFEWATGIGPHRERKGISVMPAVSSVRNNTSRDAIVGPFTHSYRPFPAQPMTIGAVSTMVSLRRSVAEGTARPADIQAYEATVAKRVKEMDDAANSTAEAIVASRSERILFMGSFVIMFQVAERVRALGFSAKDFHPENALRTGSGLKGAKLPADYRERIMDTFNLQPQYICHCYGMQELNTQFPRCAAGRYHIAPWVMLLLLDETGDRLLEPRKGDNEGRAGFFDLSLDGRWGGVITGDKIKVDFGECACGHQGPSVDPHIVRYADLPTGDKITCAGTIGAYIRGVAGAQ